MNNQPESEAEYQRATEHAFPRRSPNFREVMALRAVKTEAMRKVLAQEERWVDRNGNTIPLHTINRRYATNILNMLARNAERLWQGACADLIFLPMPRGEMAELAFEQEQDELHQIGPDRWLQSQPMVKALQRKFDPPPRPKYELEVHAQAVWTDGRKAKHIFAGTRADVYTHLGPWINDRLQGNADEVRLQRIRRAP